MEGRMLAILFLGLALANSGCITTTEKNVTIRDQGDPVPPTPVVKEEEKKAPPVKMLFAMATMKEGTAETSKDPEMQARLRDEARCIFQEVLKTEPDNVEAVRGLARVYVRMGDYGRAQETYRKALAQHPREVALWYDCGMMHDRKKDWPDGIKCFEQGLAISPENQDCLKALGFTLARAGQFEQSLAYLTRAVGAATAHYNLARMQLHLAEKLPAERTPREDLARQHLRHALNENPSYEDARNLLARLETPGGTEPRTIDTPTATPRH
jgi:tetratricopeptide (TPR) repeat protein